MKPTSSVEVKVEAPFPLTNRQERYIEIATEIIKLVGSGDSPLGGMFGRGVEGGNEKLDERLQYVIDHLDEFTTGELTMYIRGSYSSSAHLKNWLPLLKAAKQKCKDRGENADEIFRGLNNVWGKN